MTGFSDDFDLEIESNSNKGTASNFKRQERMLTVGQEISVGRKGIIELKVPGKGGKEVVRRPTELNVVIVDASFARQQWVDGTPTTPASRICGTVSHTIKLKDDTLKPVDGGVWKLTYGDKIINERYNPFGQKQDGRLLNCQTCMDNGENENCRQKGNLYGLILGMTNDDDEMVSLATPLPITFKAALGSGIEFQKYVTGTLAKAKIKPNQVVTRVSVEQTTNKLAYKLTFSMEDEFDSSDLAKAQAIFDQAKEQAAAAEAQRIEEFKAAKAATGGKSFGGRTERVAKADKLAEVSEDDDFVF